MEQLGPVDGARTVAPCSLEATEEPAEPAATEQVVATVGPRVSAETVGPPERLARAALVARAATVAAVRSREPARWSEAPVVRAVTRARAQPVMAATVAPRRATPM